MTGDEEFQFKPLSRDAISAAMDKMRRYRLLNEPEEAESICRDILRVDPEYRNAKIGLLLCLTDQFSRDLAHLWPVATEIVESLDGDYNPFYYRGIMCERRAKTHFKRRSPQSGCLAYSWLRKAMEWFDQAAEHRPPDDDACILRWNSCARMIRDHDDIRPAAPEDEGPDLLE